MDENMNMLLYKVYKKTKFANKLIKKYCQILCFSFKSIDMTVKKQYTKK